ncbi:TPA: phage major capsid protein [Bacillus nitratireducens]
MGTININGNSPEIKNQLERLQSQINELATKGNRLPGGTPQNQTGITVGEKAVKQFKSLLQTKSFTGEDGLYRDYREQKALGFNSGSATSGHAFAPEGLANEILTRQLTEAGVKSALGFVSTPSDPFSFPVDDTAWNCQVIAPGVQGSWNDTNDTVNNSKKLTINHSKIMASTTISTEFQEDTIPIALQQIQAGAAFQLARKEEQGVLFDATNGLKATAIVDAGASVPLVTGDETGAHLSENLLLSVTTSLDAGYANMEDLVYIISPKLRNVFLRLPNFVSRDKIANPTNMTGKIGSFFGAQVVSSEFVDHGNTAGDYSVLVVNRKSVKIGQRRGVNFRMFPIVGDQDRLEVTMRTGLSYPILNTGKNVGARTKLFKLA